MGRLGTKSGYNRIIFLICQFETPSVIARSIATKQSTCSGFRMDCFAPLAMTEQLIFDAADQGDVAAGGGCVHAHDLLGREAVEVVWPAGFWPGAG